MIPNTFPNPSHYLLSSKLSGALCHPCCIRNKFPCCLHRMPSFILIIVQLSSRILLPLLIFQEDSLSHVQYSKRSGDEMIQFASCSYNYNAFLQVPLFALLIHQSSTIQPQYFAQPGQLQQPMDDPGNYLGAWNFTFRHNYETSQHINLYY